MFPNQIFKIFSKLPINEAVTLHAGSSLRQFCGSFETNLHGDRTMKHNLIDSGLQRKIQSKEFERSVDEAVQAFKYDLDFMLLEEQHMHHRNMHSLVRPTQLNLNSYMPAI